MDSRGSSSNDRPTSTSDALDAFAFAGLAPPLRQTQSPPLAKTSLGSVRATGTSYEPEDLSDVSSATSQWTFLPPLPTADTSTQPSGSAGHQLDSQLGSVDASGAISSSSAMESKAQSIEGMTEPSVLLDGLAEWDTLIAESQQQKQPDPQSRQEQQQQQTLAGSSQVPSGDTSASYLSDSIPDPYISHIFSNPGDLDMSYTSPQASRTSASHPYATHQVHASPDSRLTSSQSRSHMTASHTGTLPPVVEDLLDDENQGRSLDVSGPLDALGFGISSNSNVRVSPQQSTQTSPYAGAGESIVAEPTLPPLPKASVQLPSSDTPVVEDQIAHDTSVRSLADAIAAIVIEQRPENPTTPTPASEARSPAPDVSTTGKLQVVDLSPVHPSQASRLDVDTNLPNLPDITMSGATESANVVASVVASPTSGSGLPSLITNMSTTTGGRAGSAASSTPSSTSASDRVEPIVVTKDSAQPGTSPVYRPGDGELFTPISEGTEPLSSSTKDSENTQPSALQSPSGSHVNAPSTTSDQHPPMPTTPTGTLIRPVSVRPSPGSALVVGTRLVVTPNTESAAVQNETQSRLSPNTPRQNQATTTTAVQPPATPTQPPSASISDTPSGGRRRSTPVTTFVPIPALVQSAAGTPSGTPMGGSPVQLSTGTSQALHPNPSPTRKSSISTPVRTTAITIPPPVPTPGTSAPDLHASPGSASSGSTSRRSSNDDILGKSALPPPGLSTPAKPVAMPTTTATGVETEASQSPSQKSTAKRFSATIIQTSAPSSPSASGGVFTLTSTSPLTKPPGSLSFAQLETTSTSPSERANTQEVPPAVEAKSSETKSSETKSSETKSSESKSSETPLTLTVPSAENSVPVTSLTVTSPQDLALTATLASPQEQDQARTPAPTASAVPQSSPDTTTTASPSLMISPSVIPPLNRATSSVSTVPEVSPAQSAPSVVLSSATPLGDHTTDFEKQPPLASAPPHQDGGDSSSTAQEHDQKTPTRRPGHHAASVSEVDSARFGLPSPVILTGLTDTLPAPMVTAEEESAMGSDVHENEEFEVVVEQAVSQPEGDITHVSNIRPPSKQLEGGTEPTALESSERSHAGASLDQAASPHDLDLSPIKPTHNTASTPNNDKPRTPVSHDPDFNATISQLLGSEMHSAELLAKLLDPMEFAKFTQAIEAGLPPELKDLAPIYAQQYAWATLSQLQRNMAPAHVPVLHPAAPEASSGQPVEPPNLNSTTSTSASPVATPSKAPQAVDPHSRSQLSATMAEEVVPREIVSMVVPDEREAPRDTRSPSSHSQSLAKPDNTSSPDKPKRSKADKLAALQHILEGALEKLQKSGAGKPIASVPAKDAARTSGGPAAQPSAHDSSSARPQDEETRSPPIGGSTPVPNEPSQQPVLESTEPLMAQSKGDVQALASTSPCPESRHTTTAVPEPNAMHQRVDQRQESPSSDHLRQRLETANVQLAALRDLVSFQSQKLGTLTKALQDAQLELESRGIRQNSSEESVNQLAVATWQVELLKLAVLRRSEQYEYNQSLRRQQHAIATLTAKLKEVEREAAALRRLYMASNGAAPTCSYPTSFTSPASTASAVTTSSDVGAKSEVTSQLELALATARQEIAGLQRSHASEKEEKDRLRRRNEELEQELSRYKDMFAKEQVRAQGIQEELKRLKENQKQARALQRLRKSLNAKVQLTKARAEARVALKALRTTASTTPMAIPIQAPVAGPASCCHTHSASTTAPVYCSHHNTCDAAETKFTALLDKVKSDLACERERCLSLTESLNAARTELQAKTQAEADLKHQIERLQTQSACLKDENEQLRRQVEEFTHKYSEAAIEIESVRHALASANQAFTATTAARTTLEEQLRKATDSKSELESQVQRLNQRVATLASKLETEAKLRSETEVSLSIANTKLAQYAATAESRLDAEIKAATEQLRHSQRQLESQLTASIAIAKEREAQAEQAKAQAASIIGTATHGLQSATQAIRNVTSQLRQLQAGMDHVAKYALKQSLNYFFLKFREYCKTALPRPDDLRSLIQAHMTPGEGVDVLNAIANDWFGNAPSPLDRNPGLGNEAPASEELYSLDPEWTSSRLISELKDGLDKIASVELKDSAQGHALSSGSTATVGGANLTQTNVTKEMAELEAALSGFRDALLHCMRFVDVNSWRAETVSSPWLATAVLSSAPTPLRVTSQLPQPEPTEVVLPPLPDYAIECLRKQLERPMAAWVVNGYSHIAAVMRQLARLSNARGARVALLNARIAALTVRDVKSVLSAEHSTTLSENVQETSTSVDAQQKGQPFSQEQQATHSQEHDPTCPMYMTPVRTNNVLRQVNGSALQTTNPPATVCPCSVEKRTNTTGCPVHSTTAAVASAVPVSNSARATAPYRSPFSAGLNR